MFEEPAVHQYDHVRHGSESRVNSYFRRLEIADIQTGCPWRYVEPRGDRFVGLVTQGLYDSEGGLVSDMFTEFVETDGTHRAYPHQLPVYNPESRSFKYRTHEDKKRDRLAYTDGIPTVEEVVKGNSDIHGLEESENEAGSLSSPDDLSSSDEEMEETLEGVSDKTDSLPASSQLRREIITRLYGMTTLPRSTRRPVVLQDSACTQSIVRRSLQRSVMSSSAQAVLLRSNYRVPYHLNYSAYDDMWSKMYMRRRSMTVLTTVMYLCMERRDYVRAWAALACLLRAPHVSIRLLWMPALELLAWRHDLYPNTTKSPEVLLEWLAATNPALPNTLSLMYRILPKAKDFVPAAIMLRMVNGEIRSALGEAEHALKTRQCQESPECWALAAVCRLALGEPRNSRKLQKELQNCLDLGGKLPDALLKLASGQSAASDSTESSDEEGVNSADTNDQSSAEWNAEAAQHISEVSLAHSVERHAEASSQPFFSQADSLGAQLYSSDSDD